MKEVLFSLRA